MPKIRRIFQTAMTKAMDSEMECKHACILEIDGKPEIIECNSYRSKNGKTVTCSTHAEAAAIYKLKSKYHFISGQHFKQCESLRSSDKKRKR